MEQEMPRNEPAKDKVEAEEANAGESEYKHEGADSEKEFDANEAAKETRAEEPIPKDDNDASVKELEACMDEVTVRGHNGDISKVVDGGTKGEGTLLDGRADNLVNGRAKPDAEDTLKEKEKAAVKLGGVLDESSLTLTEDNVIEYLETATEIEHAPSLIKRCEEFFYDVLSASNAVKYYLKIRGSKEKLDYLLERCFDVMLENGDTILAPESKDFYDLTWDDLLKLCESEDLSCDEEVVFQAAMNWARHQLQQAGKDVNPENIREALGDVLHEIRFPVMRLQTFEGPVMRSGVLFPDDQREIYFYLANKDKYPGVTLVGLFFAFKRAARSGMASVRLHSEEDQAIADESSSLIITPENGDVNLQSVSGESLLAKGTTVKVRSKDDEGFTECPVCTSWNSIIFTPPVVLKNTTTYLFKFSYPKSSTEVKLRRRVRNFFVTVTRAPYRAERVVLQFDDPKVV